MATNPGDPDTQVPDPEDTALETQSAEASAASDAEKQEGIPDEGHDIDSLVDAFFVDGKLPEALFAPEQAQQDDTSQGEDDPDPPEDNTGEGAAEGGFTKNFRLTAKDQTEAEIFRMRKANPDMTIEEIVNKVLGRKEQQPPADSDDSSGDTPDPPETPEEDSLEALDRQKADLEALFRKQTEEFDEEGKAETILKLLDLQSKRHIAAAQAAEKATRQQQAYMQKFAEAETRAIALYPDAAVEGSELYTLMAEIDSIMTENGDPLAHSPDKPLRIAQMAAARLNIAPATPSRSLGREVPAGPKGPAGTPGRTVGKARPAAGVSTGAATSARTIGDDLLDKANTPEELEQLIKLLG